MPFESTKKYRLDVHNREKSQSQSAHHDASAMVPYSCLFCLLMLILPSDMDSVSREGTAREARGDDLNECQWPPNEPDARLRTYTTQNLVLYETYRKVSYCDFFSIHPVDPLCLYLID